MTSAQIEATKREILDAVKRLSDLNGDQHHHGVETVISQTSLGRSPYRLSRVRWYFDRLAQEGMIRIVGENFSGSFAVAMEARGWERLEMSEADFQKSKRPALATDSVAAPSPYHTFVSHAGQDREFVDRFVNDLRNVGIDAWYSKSEIKAGDSIPQKMDEGLQACKFFIIVVSKSSLASPYVQMEIDSAITRKANGGIKRIIPLKLDGTNPPSILGGLLWVDFANRDYDAAMKEITDSIFDVDLRTPLGPLPRGINEGASL